MKKSGWTLKTHCLCTHIYISIYMYIYSQFSLFRVDTFYKVTQTQNLLTLNHWF